MAEDRDRNLAAEVKEQRDYSRRWMETNFYGEWSQVFKSYLCERDPEPAPNNQRNYGRVVDAYGRPIETEEDPERTSIGMPDTWALVRRLVARVTAQPPNIKFRSDDHDLADRVSRKIMRDWDKGCVQRQQKRHVCQAALFGWSVRAWYWEDSKYKRRRRIDPFDPASLPLIAEEYGIAPDQITEEVIADLLLKYGRGKYLPISEERQGYVGPKCEFLLVADCYPEPNFMSLQGSNWFIVERRRNRAWFERLAKAYPELAPGVQELFDKHPNGDPLNSRNRDFVNFRQQMVAAINKVIEPAESQAEDRRNPMWTVIERHTPGEDPKLAYVASEDVALGEIPYPYDLEGWIAFSELTLIDSLLWGIGDSTARVTRGLQQLHDRQICMVHDLAYNILRPLVGTSNRRIVENPDMIKRHSGMRLVPLDGPGELWVVNEQSAMASVATGLNDSTDIERQLQKASGETNMSMAANVDPHQARTATGARIMAYTGDILTKDLVDMFNETSLKQDAEIMYRLNRSEMPEAVTFDAARYVRSYSSDRPIPDSDPITVTPLDFQVDGEVEVEVGSTLADDDEAKVQRAMVLWNMALSRPDKFNLDKARDRALHALGEARHLKEWAAPPPPPPPPPEVKPSVSIAFKADELPDEMKAAVLQRAGFPLQAPAPPAIGPVPSPGPTPGPPPGGGAPPPAIPDLGAEEPPMGAAALLAAVGRSPLIPGGKR